MNAVIKTTTWGLTATAAAAIMLSMNAFAQTAPPAGAPPAAAPKATTPAPAAPAKGVVEKAKDAVKGAKDAVVKKVGDTKKAVAAASACKGLDQAGCSAKGAECGWIVPTKVDAKTKKADAPYCRKVAGVAKKAVDAKAAAAVKAAAPAGAAPAAPKPTAAPGATPAPAAPKKP
jgi:hypothetical protein